MVSRFIFDPRCLRLTHAWIWIIWIWSYCAALLALALTPYMYQLPVVIWLGMTAWLGYAMQYRLARLQHLVSFGIDFLWHMATQALWVAPLTYCILIINQNFTDPWLTLIHTSRFVLTLVLAYALGTWLFLRIALTHSWSRTKQLCVVIGHTPYTSAMITNWQTSPTLALQVMGYFSAAHNRQTTAPYLGTTTQLEQYLQNTLIERVVIVRDGLDATEYQRVLQVLINHTATVHVYEQPPHCGLIRSSSLMLGHYPVLTLFDAPKHPMTLGLKRLMDILGSLVAIILLSPLLIGAALAIKLDSKGPVFFRQARGGLHGQDFMIYKFRSMTQTASLATEVQQASRQDMRITRVGRFLRQSSIDELPQLINILKGEMSLVGPRPHVQSQNHDYGQRIEGYSRRHSMTPGLTGWAQVNGYRGETAQLEQMAKRAEYDLEYIRRFTPWFDIWILLRTVWVVLKRTNAY